MKFSIDRLFLKKTKPVFDMSKSNDFSKEVISVDKDDFTYKISVNNDCTLQHFIEKISNTFDEELVNRISKNIIFVDRYNISKQTIYLLEKENISYCISTNASKLHISEKIEDHVFTKERMIIIDEYNRNYQFTSKLFDANGNMNETKLYNFGESTNKKEALLEIQQLLLGLKDFKQINRVLNISQVYSYLYLVDEEDYFPVIENDIMCLSWRFQSVRENKNVNQSSFECFDINIKETMENIGSISYNYLSSGFTYGGNVSYNIEKPFRNKHYASMALGLLKDLLRYNEYTGDKDIYVATLPNNDFSQRVAINNGGNLFYAGAVPEDDSVYYIDGVKEVKVYKIEI